MLNIYRFLMVWYNRIFRRDQWLQYIDNLNASQQGSEWKVSLDLKHPQAADLMRMLVEVFTASKATNFFSVEVYDPVTFSAYLITVQRKGRYTPVQIIEIYRAALERIADDPLLAKGAAQAALDRVGYITKESDNA